MVLAIVAATNLVALCYAIVVLGRTTVEAIADRHSAEVARSASGLSGIHDAMVAEAGFDKDLETLIVAASSDKWNHIIDRVNIVTRLKLTIAKWSAGAPYTVNYCIYLPDSGITVTDSANDSEYVLWNAVKPELLEYADKQKSTKQWCVRTLAGEDFFVDVVFSKGRCVIAYINLHDFIKALETDFYGDDYFIIATSGSSSYGDPEGISAASSMNLNESGVKTNYWRQILAVDRAMGDEIHIKLIVKNFTSVTWFFRIQLVIGVLTLIAAFLVLWVFLFVNKSVLKPIHRFSESLDSIRSGGVYDAEAYYSINELGSASSMLFEMVESIKNLKISIFEKTLEQQKIERDFLTLQIEPHFYINCLNIIHGMAQMNKNAEIQRLTDCVSEYLRYIFRAREGSSTIKDEVKHARKYLEIQKIRYGDGFDADIDIPENIMDAALPPLIIQTYVENSLKYTQSTGDGDDDVHIWVRGVLSGKEIEITVEDNGDGYNASILEKLKSGCDISDGTSKIGLMNAAARMKAAFGEGFSISYYNRPDGGAGTSFRFPYQVKL
jgi:sensor histidine kinase YesM